MSKRQIREWGPMLMQGNEACARAALAAGCGFMAGYPITPATEIPEYLSREMFKSGGVFMQLEDELGIEISDEELENIVTVGDAFEAIHKAL